MHNIRGKRNFPRAAPHPSAAGRKMFFTVRGRGGEGIGEEHGEEINGQNPHWNDNARFAPMIIRPHVMSHREEQISRTGSKLLSSGMMMGEGNDASRPCCYPESGFDADTQIVPHFPVIFMVVYRQKNAARLCLTRRLCRA